jgi:hypothetical protein
LNKRIIIILGLYNNSRVKLEMLPRIEPYGWQVWTLILQTERKLKEEDGITLKNVTLFFNQNFYTGKFSGMKYFRLLIFRWNVYRVKNFTLKRKKKNFLFFLLNFMNRFIFSLLLMRTFLYNNPERGCAYFQQKFAPSKIYKKNFVRYFHLKSLKYIKKSTVWQNFINLRYFLKSYLIFNSMLISM